MLYKKSSVEIFRTMERFYTVQIVYLQEWEEYVILKVSWGVSAVGDKFIGCGHSTALRVSKWLLISPETGIFFSFTRCVS